MALSTAKDWVDVLDDQYKDYNQVAKVLQVKSPEDVISQLISIFLNNQSYEEKKALTFEYSANLREITKQAIQSTLNNKDVAIKLANTSFTLPFNTYLSNNYFKLGLLIRMTSIMFNAELRLRLSTVQQAATELQTVKSELAQAQAQAQVHAQAQAQQQLISTNLDKLYSALEQQVGNSFVSSYNNSNLEDKISILETMVKMAQQSCLSLISSVGNSLESLAKDIPQSTP